MGVVIGLFKLYHYPFSNVQLALTPPLRQPGEGQSHEPPALRRKALRPGALAQIFAHSLHRCQSFSILNRAGDLGSRFGKRNLA